MGFSWLRSLRSHTTRELFRGWQSCPKMVVITQHFKLHLAMLQRRTESRTPESYTTQQHPWETMQFSPEIQMGQRKRAFISVKSVCAGVRVRVWSFVWGWGSRFCGDNNDDGDGMVAQIGRSTFWSERPKTWIFWRFQIQTCHPKAKDVAPDFSASMTKARMRTLNS